MQKEITLSANKHNLSTESTQSCKSTQHSCCLINGDWVLVFMNTLYSYAARQVLPRSLPHHGNERRSKWWWHYVNLLIFVILPEKRGRKKKLDTFTSHGRFCCSSTHHTTTPPTRHNNYNCTNVENKLARKNICPFFQPSMICREIMRIVSPRSCVTLEN